MVVTLLLCACDKASFVPLDGGPRPSGIQPPTRPTEADGLDVDPATLVLRDLSLRGEGMRGWDLDGRCTLESDDGRAPDFECSPTNDLGAHVIDYPGCRDDAYGGEVAGAFQPLGTNLEADLNAAAVRGLSGLLFRLSEWSGEPDDPQVQVELAPVAFGVPEGGIRGDALAWDGLDTFNTVASAVEPDGRAIIRAEDAYVARGTLVARFADTSTFVLRAVDSSVTLHLGDAMLTAEISGDAMTDIVLSGRWRVEDLVEQLGAIGICEGDPLHAAAEIRIRNAPDVRAVPRGGLGTASPCEALSVSIGLVGYAGRWGDVLEPDTLPPRACPVDP